MEKNLKYSRISQPPNITARRRPPLVRRYPDKIRAAAQNACSPITAGVSPNGMSPLKMRRGTFCMEAKGVSSAK